MKISMYLKKFILMDENIFSDTSSSSIIFYIFLETIIGIISDSISDVFSDQTKKTVFYLIRFAVITFLIISFIRFIFIYLLEKLERSDEKAVERLHKTAQQGDVTAQFKLASAYVLGQGVPQNYREAARLCGSAVERELKPAQHTPHRAPFQGRGVIDGIVSAHMWFNIKASHCRKDAKKAAELRDIIERSMKASQIKEAKRKANEWISKNIEKYNKDEGKKRRIGFLHRFSPPKIEEYGAKGKKVGEIRDEGAKHWLLPPPSR